MTICQSWLPESVSSPLKTVDEKLFSFSSTVLSGLDTLSSRKHVYIILTPLDPIFI